MIKNNAEAQNVQAWVLRTQEASESCHPAIIFFNQRDGNIIKKILSILLAVELFEIGLQIFEKLILQDSQL